MLATLRQPNYALLWVGGLISVLGDWVLIAALPFYVYNLTGSALASGGMFIALTMPNVLLGSVAGVFADRWDRRRVMVAADFSRAVVLLLLLAVRSPDWIWLVYAVAALDAAISQFFSPAKNALLPQFAGADHLVAANALGGINNSIGRLLGPALGGVLLGVFGLPSVVAADSLSYLVSGLLIARISVSARGATRAASETPGTAWTRAWTDWLDGLRLVRRSRSLTIFFIVIAIAAGAEGIYQVIFVVFVKQALHGGGARVRLVAEHAGDWRPAGRRDRRMVWTAPGAASPRGAAGGGRPCRARARYRPLITPRAGAIRGRRRAGRGLSRRVQHRAAERGGGSLSGTPVRRVRDDVVAARPARARSGKRPGQLRRQHPSPHSERRAQCRGRDHGPCAAPMRLIILYTGRPAGGLGP